MIMMMMTFRADNMWACFLVHRSVIFARDVITCITVSYKLAIQLRKFGGEIL